MDKKLDIKLICCDAVEGMRSLPDESIDLIVTDPPYNLQKDYGNCCDNLDFESYIDFSSTWLREAKRVLKQTGTIYVFMGMRFISYIYKILEIDLGLYFNSWITWHYTQGIGKTKGYSPRHDDILMFTKSKNYTFNIDDIRIPQKYYRNINNMRGANPGNVWEFSHVHYCNAGRENHPTQKPEGVFERMILASSNIGDVVLDPFVGSGTSARVCQQLDRKFIGFDNNIEYISLSQARLEKPFIGFDSVDVRMSRMPYDMNDEKYREEYIRNHIIWFLSHHENVIKTFWDDIKIKYPPGKNFTERG